MTPKGSRRDLRHWVSWQWAARAEARGIKSLDSVHINGKLRDQQWWESHFVEVEVQKGIREELTGYDNSTLRAEALEELGLHGVRPSFEEGDFLRDAKNRIRTWTDGALKLEIRYGTYAVYLGKKEAKFTAGRIYGALSSFEAELRAVWNVLRSLPLDQSMIIYTDSESVITRITNRRGGDKRKESNERYEAYMQRILKIIREKRNVSATTDLEFVYSHLLDTNPPTMSEADQKTKEEKRRKMENKYASDTEMILTGNQRADELAGALKNTNHGSYRNTPSADDPRYILEIDNTIITKDHRKECYNAAIHPIISQNKWEHIDAFDWWLHEAIDMKNSCHFTQSKWRSDVKNIEFIFRCRNGRLTTTKKENEKVIKELQSNRRNYYIEKRRRLYSSPHCPFGCTTDETIDHICKCKNTSNIREEAKRQIRERLYQEELTPNFIDEIWWFSDQGTWKEKFAWMAFIPNSTTTALQAKIGEAKMIPLLCDAQRIAAAAIKEMWTRRCIKLHMNNPPKNPEEELAEMPMKNSQTRKRKEVRELPRKQKKTSKSVRAVQTKKKKTSTLRKTPAAPSTPLRTDSSNTNTHTHTQPPTNIDNIDTRTSYNCSKTNRRRYNNSTRPRGSNIEAKEETSNTDLQLTVHLRRRAITTAKPSFTRRKRPHFPTASVANTRRAQHDDSASTHHYTNTFTYAYTHCTTST